MNTNMNPHNLIEKRCMSKMTTSPISEEVVPTTYRNLSIRIVKIL